MNVPELLKLSGAFWTTCTIHAGVKLDVFSTLTQGAATAAELAHALQTDVRGMGMLLNALTALEFWKKMAKCLRQLLSVASIYLKIHRITWAISLCTTIIWWKDGVSLIWQ